MRKTILLIQFRRNSLTARYERECVLRCFGKGINLVSENVFRKKFNLTEEIFSKISGIILGGSSEFGFSRRYPNLRQKIKKTTPFIKKAIKENVPVLGICLGHQYLAFILGSEIIADKSQEEVGTFKVSLTRSGKTDPLFSKMPLEFFVQEGHKCSIKKLPKGAVLLAKGKKCKIQAFRFKNAYGVQFHPEMSIRDARDRLKICSNYKSGDKEINFKPSPFAKKVLKNFLRLK